MENFLNLVKILSEGLGTTLLIFTLTLLLGIPAGILVAMARNSKNKIISNITKLYILIIRGTPMMLQIIFIYFAPYYLFKINYDRFVAIIIAFVVNYAAYFAEIFRSGILSIPKGQKEAAFTLGFSRTQTFFRILLPQIIKRILPSNIINKNNITSTNNWYNRNICISTKTSKLSIFYSSIMCCRINISNFMYNNYICV